MSPLVVGNSLVVVVEADIFRGQELKAPNFVSIFLGETDKVTPVLFLRVSIVDDDAITLFYLFLSYFITFLFGL